MSDELDRFLDDESLPAAIFHSNALDRDFVLARDPDALVRAELSDHERSLPVIYFDDCPRLSKLGKEGMRCVLDIRSEFGPSVKLT